MPHEPPSLPASVPGVADVVQVRGARAQGTPSLLVEVPHGADRRAHYDAQRSQLVGALPDDLHAFFHVNTDVGAWDIGLAAAQAWVSADPHRAAVAIRCLLPRTFVDTNRRLDQDTGRLSQGGLTPGLPGYIQDPRDQALLTGLHRRYLDVVEPWVDAVCGAGGRLLVPHTYAPRSVGIEAIDADIVSQLRAAYVPQVYATWPERPAVDLITTTPEGEDLAIPGIADRMIEGLGALGIEVGQGHTYPLHPATQAWRYARRHPGQSLCLEVRRDLVCDPWVPFEEQVVDRARTTAIGRVLAERVLAELVLG